MGDIYKETSFMTWWRAVNAHLRSAGYPELLFGDAHRLWKSTMTEAQERAFITAWRAA